MLQKALQFIRERGYNVYSVCEWKDGNEQKEELQPANHANNCYSLSKSFTSAAIGMLEYAGKLSRGDKIGQYIGDLFPAGNADKLQKVTVRNLLSHAAGFAEGVLFEGDRYNHGTDDWAEFSLSQPMPYAAGEKSVYSNATYYLLSRIAEKAAGETLFDYLHKNLLRPLGFRDYAANACPLGHTFGASGMFFACEDLVKFGRLFLGGGIYEGKRYLAADYVREAASPLLPNGNRLYGLGFWKNSADDGYYYGDGAHGQLILVCPAKNAVLAMQSYDNTIDMRGLTAYLAG